MQYIILKPDFKNYLKGTSLVVQWVIFCASTAGDSRFHPWSGKLRFSRLCSVAKKKKKRLPQITITGGLYKGSDANS